MTTLPATLAQLAAGPIFVVGCVRSGTTWVTDLFAAHPEVAAVNESFVFSNNRGLAVLDNPNHWHGDAGLIQLLDRDELVQEVRSFSATLLSHALAEQHRYLVEKTPPHLYSVKFISSVYPEARFIHVVRDGRDVAVSIRAAGRSWAPSWRRTVARSTAASARAWVEALDEAEVASRHVGPDRWFEVRYEDLKVDPFPWYRRLFDFARIECDDALLGRIIEATTFANVHTGGEGEFYRRGVAGEWRERLPLGDAVQFELIAGAKLRARGYEHSRTWWKRQPLRWERGRISAR